MNEDIARIDDAADCARALPRPNHSVRVVKTIHGMAEFFESSVSVLSLKRPPNKTLVDEAGAALDDRTFQVRTTATPGSRKPIDGLIAFPHLNRDVSRWVEVLGDLTGSETIGIRLARLEQPMCPRFHVDFVTVRVVVTVVGRGTQFLANEDVRRQPLANPQGNENDTAFIEPGATIHEADAGDVVLLKGERWPQNATRGAVHRSPPASPEFPRLVCTLDPL